MEINGLPAHALVIHGAVVFGPLAGLLALVYLLPPLRDRLRAPLLLTALAAATFVVLAYVTGNDYLDSTPGLEQLPLVRTHQARAELALWVTLAFSVVALLATALHRRTGVVRLLLGLLLAAGAVGTIVTVVLTGDAGAQSSWGA